MRVAYTLEQCWHDVPGGTAVAALAVARRLVARADVEVVGVAAHHRHPPPEGWRPPVPVRHLLLPRPALYEAWARLGRPAVQRTTGPVDVVHATTILAPPPGGAPLVVTVHDLAFLHEPAHFTRRGVAAFRRGLDRLRGTASLVLCSSQATLDDCRAAGIDPARLRHVPLGVESAPPPDPATVDEVRRRHGLDRPYLLFVGTLEPRKNLARLVDAVNRRAGDQVLAVAGQTGWGDGAPPPGADRVVLLGFVTEDDKRALYAGADAFCYPSLREGFGLPVLEAMAAGAPVVTSRGTATQEAAGAAAVLVDPHDPDDIARGIDDALARRAELRAAGTARAAACSWSVTADATVAAYREVLGS